ncbi:MAG: hypothetical protein AB7U79_06690 [Candidatus Izemoplasmatales bacterium]
MLKPFNKFIFIIKAILSVFFILATLLMRYYIHLLGPATEGVHYEALAFIFFFVVFVGCAFISTSSLIFYSFRYFKIKKAQKHL